MEVVRSIDQEKRIVYTTITGKMTLAEIRADMMSVATIPGYESDMPAFVDLRQATAGLTGGEIRQIADAIKSRPKKTVGARRALLVSSDLMYGLYRMFSVFASGSNVEYRIFRDEKLAHAWLEEVSESPRREQNCQNQP